MMRHDWKPVLLGFLCQGCGAFWTPALRKVVFPGGGVLYLEPLERPVECHVDPEHVRVKAAR
jgi:hypothetical protein